MYGGGLGEQGGAGGGGGGRTVIGMQSEIKKKKVRLLNSIPVSEGGARKPCFG